MRRWHRKAVMVIVAGALGGAGIGYLASNAVSDSSAGAGTGHVTVTITTGSHHVTTSSTPIVLKP